MLKKLTKIASSYFYLNNAWCFEYHKPKKQLYIAKKLHNESFLFCFNGNILTYAIQMIWEVYYFQLIWLPPLDEEGLLLDKLDIEVHRLAGRQHRVIHVQIVLVFLQPQIMCVIQLQKEYIVYKLKLDFDIVVFNEIRVFNLTFCNFSPKCSTTLKRLRSTKQTY